jgi:hypothetical protein
MVDAVGLSPSSAATMPLVQQPPPTQVNHDPDEPEELGDAVESVVETQVPLAYPEAA